MSADAKRLLRAEILTWLRQLPAEHRAEKSERLCSRLADHPAFYDGLVLVFASLNTEPDLTNLWNLGVPLVFPKVKGEELELWMAREPDDLALRGSFGIREPDPARCQAVPLNAIDLILTPGLAFDRQTGARLGRGGGYYDRLLAQYGGETIGICFREQVLDDLPVEKHDRRVGKIATDAMTIWIEQT